MGPRWVAVTVLSLAFIGRAADAADCVFIPDMHWISQPGADYPKAPAEDTAECCDLCAARDGCAGAVFQIARKQCWFKDKATALKANEQKMDGNTACLLGKYATPAEKAEGTEADDGVGDTGGMTFVIVLAVAGAAYVGGGVMHATKSGAPVSLWSHPHASRWESVVGLVQDGIAFSRGHKGRGGGRGGGGGSGSYAPVKDNSARQKPSGSNKGEGKDSGTKSSKRKEGKERSHEKRQRSPQSGKSMHDAADAARSEPAPAVTAAPVTAEVAPAKPSGTAAGGGGRWVHLPG
jgi:hypothetical protein